MRTCVVQLGVCCRLHWTGRCSWEGVVCVSGLEDFVGREASLLRSCAMHPPCDRCNRWPGVPSHFFAHRSWSRIFPFELRVTIFATADGDKVLIIQSVHTHTHTRISFTQRLRMSLYLTRMYHPSVHKPHCANSSSSNNSGE